MTAATARLWTGMGAVGSLFVTAALAMLLGIPDRLLPSTVLHPLAELASISALVLGVVFVLLPFDILGGILIPAAFDRNPPRFGQWLGGWLRSVSVQVVLFVLTLFVYLQIGREVGTPWLVALFAVVQLSLLAGQELIWRAMTLNRPVIDVDEQTTLVTHSDPRFAGGVTGLPGFETILVPQRWADQLESSFLQAVIQRRKLALQSGVRARGVLLAMTWNLTCFAAAVLISGGSVTTVADVATLYCWFLLLSFVGLITLPTINRNAVVWLDRQSANRSGTARPLTAAITAVDHLTERDPRRTNRSESIFQPIPCPERRVKQLRQTPRQRSGFWNVARTTLFLSWAFAGPLSRAVHCNVGRPELWAMLPTD